MTAPKQTARPGMPRPLPSPVPPSFKHRFEIVRLGVVQRGAVPQDEASVGGALLQQGRDVLFHFRHGRQRQEPRGTLPAMQARPVRARLAAPMSV